MRPHSTPNTVRKEAGDKDPTNETAWGDPVQFTSSQQRINCQRSSSSSWRSRVREDAETSTSTGRPQARLTPARKYRKDPSIEFQTLRSEDQDLKDHIIQNMWLNCVKNVNKLDNFPVNEAIWSMFRNGCMWAVFYLSEEGENVKRIMVTRHSHKTQTIIETVQVRLQNLKNNASLFCPRNCAAAVSENRILE